MVLIMFDVVLGRTDFDGFISFVQKSLASDKINEMQRNACMDAFPKAAWTPSTIVR